VLDGGGKEFFQHRVAGGVAADAVEGRPEFFFESDQFGGSAAIADDAKAGGDERTGGGFADAGCGACDDGDAGERRGHGGFSLGFIDLSDQTDHNKVRMVSH